MAREQILKVSDTNFNISNIHVSRVKSLLNKFDTVIIHGDGAMFAGSDALTGSDYHKSFNAGYEVNKAEVISRAKFRAIYKKGDAAPTCPEDILSEFYLNANKEIQDTTKPELAKTNNNFFLEDEIEELEPETETVRRGRNPGVKTEN